MAVLFEYVFGLVPDVPSNRLAWHVRLLEEHGVEQYPFGEKTLIDLHVQARRDTKAEPVITARSSEPIQLDLLWEGGSKSMTL